MEFGEFEAGLLGVFWDWRIRALKYWGIEELGDGWILKFED